jgi:hypothetical protein
MARPAPVHSVAALARAIPCDLALASFAKARCLCRGHQLSGLFSDRGCAAELRRRLLPPYPCKSIHMATRNSTSTGVHARAMLGWNFCRRADTSCNCASLSSDSRRRACGEASAVPPARREYMSAWTVDAAALAGASFISDHTRSSEKSSLSRRRVRTISALSCGCPAGRGASHLLLKYVVVARLLKATSPRWQYAFAPGRDGEGLPSRRSGLFRPQAVGR